MQNDGAADVTLERSFTVDNELGLHLRAAGKFSQTAGRFAASILVKKDGVEVNAKSIMGILSLAAARGSCLQVRCSGADAERAMDAIAALFEKKFHEE